jgi:hypothetical protein
VNKSQGKHIIPNETFKTEDQLAENDFILCQPDEDAVEAWRTKEMGVATKVICMLTPINH